MIRRVAAVEATIARFDGLPLTYGKDDCARMVAFALRKQGARVALLKAGQYSSKLGAAKALKKLGHESIVDALDAALPARRIAPAACLPGDIMSLPAEAFGGALFLAIGNGRAFGYFDGRFQVGQPLTWDTAWRSIDG